MSKMCVRCGGKCCRYFCFEIDAPEDYDEFEDVRWFLLHEGVSVHVDKGEWYISIANTCKMLQSDNLCGVYETRPTICRVYETATCDLNGGDYGYDEVFETPEQLEAYARRTLGEAVFERKRAKAWGRAPGKAGEARKTRRAGRIRSAAR
jgi:Fe-S-cluster containining protein